MQKLATKRVLALAQKWVQLWVQAWECRWELAWVREKAKATAGLTVLEWARESV